MAPVFGEEDLSFSWKKITLIVSLLALLAAAAAMWQIRRINEFETVIILATNDALRLEAEIGYGGLIHNFKNYLIRPHEDVHRIKAEKNAVRAKELISRLEATAQSLKIDIALAETDEMVDAYHHRLHTVQALSAEQLSISEIDAAVRYNDDGAVNEIDAALDKITETANAKISYAAMVSNIQLAFMGIMTTGGLFSAVLARKARRHAREIGSKNTRLEQSNEKLADANLALQQFAGIASHDLRSPIGHIRFFADMIDRKSETEAVRIYTDRLRETSNAMNIMVSSLLDFARSGFKEPNLEPVDMERLVADVIREREAEIEQRKASIRVAAGMPVIHAEPELLRRVFHNLIGNSLKYIHEEKTPDIEIAYEATKDNVILSVSDNGIGIEEAHAQRIFEPMQRLHKDGGKYSGVGIGLALVKSIIESHGGAIWLDTAYKNGSRFVFSLPKTEEVEPIKEPADNSPPPVATRRTA